jgi:N-acetyl-anhydromuramyl-L-alanine amidase AmpD
MREIDSALIHCYGTDLPQFDNVECCYQWHVVENGWTDIGYHFIITKDGKTHKCRPIERWGAHEPKMNENSVGICFTGEFNFTDKQYKELAKLLNKLMKKYGFGKDRIFGHYEFSKKTCPNFNVKKFKKYYL